MLPEQIRDALTARKLTICTAESLTAGLVSSAIASVSGSSRYLLGGVAVYNIDAKVNMLGVNRELAAQCDCVSDQVAAQMANGVRTLMGADISIATTGYAETQDPRGPYAYICVSFHQHYVTRCVEGYGLSRNAMREMVAQEALKLVLAVLEAD